MIRLIKRLLKKMIRRSKGLKRIIIRLNKIVTEENKKPAEISIFTKKAMFTGNSVDYLNSRILTREDRANELKQIFYKKCGYYLDLDNPQTFNQKLNWLKLYYYQEDYPKCVDKYDFKQYIADHIGEGYTVPLYGVWEKESQVDLDALPDQFVLKSTLQSDGKHIIVVRDKSTVDLDKLKTVMSSWLLPRNCLINSYCVAYSQTKPRIIAEELIEGFDTSLVDYKFMCFNGKAEMLFVVSDRAENMSINFYDLDWNLLPFTRQYPNTEHPVNKPINFDKMVEIANKLAEPFPFVRVDFYESAEGKLYVGELTFYPGGGYETFQPIEWDYKLGEMLHLPEANV